MHLELEVTLDLLIENTRRLQNGEDVEAQQEALLDHLVSLAKNLSVVGKNS